MVLKGGGGLRPQAKPVCVRFHIQVIPNVMISFNIISLELDQSREGKLVLICFSVFCELSMGGHSVHQYNMDVHDSALTLTRRIELGPTPKDQQQRSRGAGASRIPKAVV